MSHMPDPVPPQNGDNLVQAMTNDPLVQPEPPDPEVVKPEPETKPKPRKRGPMSDEQKRKIAEGQRRKALRSHNPQMAQLIERVQDLRDKTKGELDRLDLALQELRKEHK